MSTPNLAQMVAAAERISKDIESRGGEYLYDGFQYWLCTETGDEVALCPRTFAMFLDFVKRVENRV